MFGFTEEQMSAFGLSFGIGAFMLYMLFVLFLGLAFGMTGFLAKYIIQWVIQR
jgi:hypothetical protein